MLGFAVARSGWGDFESSASAIFRSTADARRSVHGIAAVARGIPVLAEHLSRARLSAIAGSAAFVRGEEYFAEGAVSRLEADADGVSARVEGTQSYRVRLWEQDGDLRYRCTCPRNADGFFCKHCVAVALTWLAEAPKRGKQHQDPWQPIRDFLALQDTATLVGWLLDQARKDDALHERLRLLAARESGPAASIKAFRDAIDRATTVPDYVDWREAAELSGSLHDLLDSLAELLDQDGAAMLVVLAEHFAANLDALIERVDDSGGELGELAARAGELHLAACRAAQPEPEALAERLFGFEMEYELDTFHDSVARYAEVLGERGLRRFRELAEAEWAQVEPRRSGEGGYDGRRWRITGIMEQLARQGGDLEALVAIKSRDLSTSMAYLAIAEIYRDAGRHDEALDWAECGLAAFADRPDDRLRDFLAAEYLRRGRTDEALAQVRLQFTGQPSLYTYRKVRNVATAIGTWPEVRAQALELLERHLRNRPSRSGYFADASPGISILVEVLLDDGDLDAAWAAAHSGECAQRLWLQLAELRGPEHPEESIAVYRRCIGPIIEQTNNTAYAEALGLLKKIRPLLARLGREAELGPYLAELRAKYKPKRNFVKLLDAWRASW